MKFQPKRFIVEVKRGTSRAAFSSPDPSSDRFSSAEAMLFGGTPKAEGRAQQPRIESGDAPGGRILRSLVEPPEPVVEDQPAPARRGRKPGSKNKPKTGAVASQTASDPAAERPRRGRKPGSKNKPKAPVIAVFPSATSAARSSVVDAMRSYGFTDDAATLQGSPPPSEAKADQRAPLPSATAAEDAPRGAGRPRLRDRSTILKRYVLDLEPRPGHPGALRARRRARTGR